MKIGGQINEFQKEQIVLRDTLARGNEYIEINYVGQINPSRNYSESGKKIS